MSNERMTAEKFKEALDEGRRNFGEITVEGVLNLETATLRYLDLEGATLEHLNLSSATLGSLNISNATLGYLNMRNATFGYLNLNNITVEEIYFEGMSILNESVVNQD